MGNIGTYHADYLLKGQVARCELTAVCGTNADSLAKYGLDKSSPMPRK
jgi:hypothetical protein